jgi:hypothetical protein
MRVLALIFAALLTGPMLASCTTVNMQNNTQASPSFVLEDYFLGETRAYGVFEDLSGKVTRSFTVVAKGSQTPNGFVLDERFLWNDGEKQTRTWTFKRKSNGVYEAFAGDVKGAAEVTQGGNAIRIKYLLNLPNGNGTITVRADDWSHLIADGVAINRADISKFGIKVGRVTLSFYKPGTPSPVADDLSQSF